MPGFIVNLMSNNLLFIFAFLICLYFAVKVVRGIGRIVFSLLSLVSAAKWILWLIM